MPIYEYTCPSCGNTFDVRQSFSATPVAACPTCSTQAQRKMQIPAIVFNAPGFYVSDQRRNGPGNFHYNKAAEEDKSGGSSSAAPGTAD